MLEENRNIQRSWPSIGGQSQYSLSESGQVKLSIDGVVAISKILNLDISELVSDQTVV